MKLLILSLFATLSSLTLAQLSGSVGPLTSIATKTAKKTCNVLNYGAKADKSTDLGPPLASAFAACKSGGVVVIPSGNYAMSTFVTLSGGSAWALQLDGIIYRTGTAGGNMIFVEHTSDFELFSSTGNGAMQGNGYLIHPSLSGARTLRFYAVSNFAVHDIKLVDAPAFHFSLDTCTNGEVYNMIIRGGDHGGLDGIDVWSTNIWIHDIMVTNHDECVTVKSPSQNILIENIYCNDSGGCAFGSLGANTAISDVTYRNVYTQLSNQMMMIKSNGGSGYVKNVVLENFIGHKNAYSLDIDQYWSSMSAIAGNGVQLSGITIKNWKGTEANGANRGPVKVICADGAPCTGVAISDFAMWTESGSSQFYSCRSAYGSGFCLKADTSSPKSYAVTSTTVKSAPSGYSAATMPQDLATGFGFTVSIPIPTAWPASYYPGAARISPYASAASAINKIAVFTSTTGTTATPTSSMAASTSATSKVSSRTSSTLATSTSKKVDATSIPFTLSKLMTTASANVTISSNRRSSFSDLPTTGIAIVTGPPMLPSKNITSTSSMPFMTSALPTTVAVPTYPATNSTSPASFTSTWTGQWGKPTKFVCYAEE